MKPVTPSSRLASWTALLHGFDFMRADLAFDTNLPALLRVCFVESKVRRGILLYTVEKKINLDFHRFLGSVLFRKKQPRRGPLTAVGF